MFPSFTHRFKYEYLLRVDEYLYDFCVICLRLLNILSYRLIISGQEVLIIVLYGYSRYLLKVERVDAIWRILAVKVNLKLY